jgi:hypothetical protein
VAVDEELRKRQPLIPRMVPFWTSSSMIPMLPAWSTVPTKFL